MKKLALVFAILAAIALSGCGATEEYVKSDEALYAAVADEYLDLARKAKKDDGSARFTADEVTRRERTMKLWRARIDANK